MAEESKHQTILPKNHPLAQLIIRNVHKDNLHAGREHRLTICRKWYWIPNCRGMIRQILNDYITRKGERAAPQNSLMGDLPKVRVESGGKAFRNTGVDYFGPCLVKGILNGRPITLISNDISGL